MDGPINHTQWRRGKNNGTNDEGTAKVDRLSGRPRLMLSEAQERLAC